MKIKQTEQKSCTGLPRAKFPKSIRKRRSTAKALKVKIGKFNRIPFDTEEAPSNWYDLSPLLPSSPEVENFADHLNKECEATARVHTPPGSPPTAPSIGETLQLLVVPAEEPQAGSPRPLPILCTPPRSPFEDGMTEELPLPDLPGETPPGVEATVSPPTDLNQEEHSQKECTREEKEDSVPQDRTENCFHLWHPSFSGKTKTSNCS